MKDIPAQVEAHAHLERKQILDGCPPSPDGGCKQFNITAHSQGPLGPDMNKIAVLLSPTLPSNPLRAFQSPELGRKEMNVVLLSYDQVKHDGYPSAASEAANGMNHTSAQPGCQNLAAAIHNQVAVQASELATASGGLRILSLHEQRQHVSLTSAIFRRNVRSQHRTESCTYRHPGDGVRISGISHRTSDWVIQKNIPEVLEECHVVVLCIAQFCMASRRRILAMSIGIRNASGSCRRNHSLLVVDKNGIDLNSRNHGPQTCLQGITTPTTNAHQMIVQGLIKLPGDITLAFVPRTLSVYAAAVKQSDVPSLASSNLSSFERTSLQQKDSATLKTWILQHAIRQIKFDAEHGMFIYISDIIFTILFAALQGVAVLCRRVAVLCA